MLKSFKSLLLIAVIVVSFASCKEKQAANYWATDTGVTISFNSVKSLDGIWTPVYENSVTCINPISWTTDATPADFSFGGQNVAATVDTVLNVVMVKDFVKPELPFEEVWPEDCLHFYDIQFYNNSLRENVLSRAYKR